jgi:cyclase
MFRPRVVPVLLLRGAGLVKTVGFRDPRYVGDPINAVKIFDELFADELVLLDILATREGRSISAELVGSLGGSTPLAVGGGIRALEQIRAVLAAGAEKVVIGTHAVENPGFVREAATHFGSSTVMVCIDVKRSANGAPRVWSACATRESDWDPIVLARRMEAEGAGELIVQSIDRDGTRRGYDLELIRSISSAVEIPVIALGGAGELRHLREAHVDGHASAVAAGSLFVMHGRLRGVLINYPERSELPF